LRTRFRPAEKRDLATLLAFSEALYLEDGTVTFDPVRARAGFCGLIGDESLGRVWMIEAGGRPVGYVVLTWGFTVEYWGRVGLVDELYVLPEHRDRGLGTAAMELAERSCRERGIRAVQLEVSRENVRAQELYRRLGFVDHDRYLMTKELTMQFHPLTPKRWPDFEKLFGKSGACGGCWCMWWRQTRAQFTAGHGERNRRAMKRIVESGEVPGILAYAGREPVGWCAVAPRERYPTVERSRVLKRLDDEPVWSIVCLFVAKEHRSQGVAVALIKAAVDHAARCGARVVEAYPTMPRGRKLPGISIFMGVPAQYEKAGFTLRARPSAARGIMRREVG
jgi:ribosomal protein S18 acetylase RimI-like enzyme